MFPLQVVLVVTTCLPTKPPLVTHLIHQAGLAAEQKVVVSIAHSLCRLIVNQKIGYAQLLSGVLVMDNSALLVHQLTQLLVTS